MTTLSERIRAVKHARGFIAALADPKLYPKLPKYVRQEALRLSRHFPYDFETEAAFTLAAEKRNEPMF